MQHFASQLSRHHHPHASHPSEEATSLRKTHLNVLSTAMHRCLLDGDYDRAARAWGMLLRTHVAGGRPVDARNHGRWGIGAEILLRRHHANPSPNNRAPTAAELSTSPEPFSEHGFALARDYFERLIVQHPNRKLTPNALDERTFYPAMFSLWVLDVCEKSKRMRNKPQEHEELARATEIVNRLDQLIASPPFDKHASLLHLRGHVSLWVSALLLAKATADENGDMDADQGDAVSVTEQLNQLAHCERELLQAQRFLARAESNGATSQKATLTMVTVKLRQIATLSARLRRGSED